MKILEKQRDMLNQDLDFQEFNKYDKKAEKKKKEFRNFLKKSICSCGRCGAIEKDMAYHEGWGEWWCVDCFRQEKEDLKPERFFNKGVVVDAWYATKPCWILDWCPYGALVEDFLMRSTDSKYTCNVFDHDCPVFYLCEKFTEDSPDVPTPDPLLKDSLRNCEAFNDKTPIVYDIKKPCHKLEWCPYGSMGDAFYKREKDYKYGCNIFPRDCPAFFHAEKIREPPLW